jgi:hypothetical protein
MQDSRRSSETVLGPSLFSLFVDARYANKYYKMHEKLEDFARDAECLEKRKTYAESSSFALKFSIEAIRVYLAAREV